MKFLIVFALCVAAASARFEIPDVVAAEAAEIQQILDLINHPNTDPDTAAALEALLIDFFLPGHEDNHIAVGPIIVDSEQEQGINVDPVIIDPVVPAASSPLVQVIINVNAGSPNAVNVEGSPVIEKPEPSEEISIVELPEHVAVPQEVDPTPVIVVDAPEDIGPVIVAPIPEPVVVIPETLN
ncbi:unnamed protein product [Euphydryas editha]|uniref:Actin cytoskeleton-regulatory complex protein PAN1-like n=1 Tax=Euphydryas editha TaxID=104508 RepID=A0AAU9TW22_EUPED|nr:unnamed protein product [Euphydryas editha]